MKKVAVIGPESTGKSTLCEQLAAKYHTTWVPEYAREYLLREGTDYTFDDLLTIARQQLQQEDSYVSECGGDIIFIDTEMYVMKVWCEFVFGKCHQWILDRINERRYDLYLLCNTDLAWTKDTLREYPDLESRRELFHMYKDILVNQGTPWKEIAGTENDRFWAAVKAVDTLLE